MKISNDTVNVLKNFAKINPSIIVEEGNVLKTISPTKTIMARAKVTDKFDQRFAIYNLDRFLAIVSTFTDPSFEFSDKSVNIFDDKHKIHYVYADETTITKAPNKEINLPSVDAEFKLTNDDLKNVEKAAGILGLPEIVVMGDGEDLCLQAADMKNVTGDVYSIRIGSTNKVFKAVFKSDNIKILPVDYEVSISSKGISRFVHGDIEYFIAVESSSVF